MEETDPRILQDRTEPAVLEVLKEGWEGGGQGLGKVLESCAGSEICGSFICCWEVPIKEIRYWQSNRRRKL